ncbi:MAG: hypothetical protein DWQ47_15915 [Acidobacteria bacterium]|nr:MAG: hypothetical protein DWQ32_03315 [Acidobacteriota bacterium]REK02456.1 MAG: hypothetical protein DWQ38_08820 [Acidobacteriota bacterium]REK13742.1 MAG: hypothetical protein DWQ43_09005 [Acidobacteriota bacterium]REK41736.1 MAG: hypothetical protein DWQ47_15915 [Acidobacteriota bacterium]
MRNRLSQIVIGLVLAILAFPGISNSQTTGNSNPGWRTKEFKVLWYSPDWSDQRDELWELLQGRGLSSAEEARLEQTDSFLKTAFREIAAFYEKNGLGPPNLPLSTGDDDVERWEIYAYRFTDFEEVTEAEQFAAGYYGPNTCGIDAIFSAELALNVSRILDPSNQITDSDKESLYSTAAHELFHAIQSEYDGNYDSLARCDSGEGDGYWPITEGTATAAGTLAFLAKYPDALKRAAIGDLRHGAFPYSSRDFMSAGSAYRERSLPNGDSRASYKTSSFWKHLVDNYGGLAVLDKLLKQEFDYSGDPDLEERYRWLDAAVKEISGKSFYIVYPEFLAEFASFGGSSTKRPFLSNEEQWLQTIYRKGGGDCHPVKLEGPNGGADSVELTSGQVLVEQGTTCFRVKWSGMEPPFVIEVEAEYPDETILDQLHLGVSRVTSGSEEDRCFEWKDTGASSEEGGSRSEFNCSFIKQWVKRSKVRSNFIKIVDRKLWDLGWPAGKNVFFSRELDGSGEAIVVLSNTAPQPWKTKKVPAGSSLNSKLTLRFSTLSVITLSSTKYKPPSYLEGIFPISFSFAPILQTADRYSFYGIVTGSRIAPVGGGPGFQAVSVSDDEKRYILTPTSGGGFAYGSTGPFKAAVWTVAGPSSITCEAAKMGPPETEITRSDDLQLRMKVKADLCVPNGDGKTARVVDTFEGEFVLPFSHRYFLESAQSDVVTPGIELYIDEFLLDATRLGIPIPPGVVMQDGTYPPTALARRRARTGSGSQTSDGETTTNDTEPRCKCTCDEYERIKKKLEEASKKTPPDRSAMSELYCWQKCMPEFRSCFVKKQASVRPEGSRLQAVCLGTGHHDHL